jgi:hypothetical protein
VLALPAIAAAALIPWTIGIATYLPHTAVAHHWNTAWAGLDVAIMIGLALTSWLSHRHNRRAALAATATATLMCADAWFDLCTSASGSPFASAVAAAATELTVAAACLVVGLRAPRPSDTRAPDGGTRLPEHGRPGWPSVEDCTELTRRAAEGHPHLPPTSRGSDRTTRHCTCSDPGRDSRSRRTGLQ